jgi:hypothetical protein
VIRQRHRVDDAHRSASGGERRLEHIGAWQVTARRFERFDGTELERPSAPGIEDRAAQARGVEIREAEPVDGAVSGDERGRPSVAYNGVILNAGVAALTNGIYSLPALGR